MTDAKTEPDAKEAPQARSHGDQLTELRELEQRVLSLKRELLETGSVASSRQTDRMDLLLGRSGSQRVAIGVGHINEVVAMPAVTPPERQTSGLLGLVNVRGDWLAVVDLAQLLGGSPSVVTAAQSLLLCHAGGRRFTMVLDEVVDVISVPNDQLNPADDVLPGVLQATGILSWEDTWFSVLDGPSIALVAQSVEPNLSLASRHRPAPSEAQSSKETSR